jgi:hypothetical protein
MGNMEPYCYLAALKWRVNQLNTDLQGNEIFCIALPFSPGVNPIQQSAVAGCGGLCLVHRYPLRLEETWLC